MRINPRPEVFPCIPLADPWIRIPHARAKVRSGAQQWAGLGNGDTNALGRAEENQIMPETTQAKVNLNGADDRGLLKGAATMIGGAVGIVAAMVIPTAQRPAVPLTSRRRANGRFEKSPKSRLPRRLKKGPATQAVAAQDAVGGRQS
jgi:hypothetical protein